MGSGCVVHLSAEYPDSLNNGRNSPVVRRLVNALSQDVSQVVVSINRTSDPRQACLVEDNARHLAVRYFALPYGIGHRFFMRRLAQSVSSWLQRRQITPALIYAHKLTVEGVVAQQVAAQFSCRYLLGFMSTTDDKYWSGLPWCRRLFQSVGANAQAWIFPTPIIQRRYLKRLPQRPNHICVIPYISGVQQEPPLFNRDAGSHALLTVFNFSNLRYKNFDRLVAAVMRLRRDGFSVALDVAGHGDPSDVAKVTRIIARHSASAAVRCIGQVAPSEMHNTMRRYGSMVLPSYPESFGLVYLEAIAAGIPVLSSRGLALDGFFDTAYPGVKVDPKSITSIADGIKLLVDERPQFERAFNKIDEEWGKFSLGHIRKAHLELFRLKRNEN